MYYGKYTWILWGTYFFEGWHTVGGNQKSRKLTGWYGKYPHHLQGFSGFSTIQTVVGKGMSSINSMIYTTENQP